MKPWLIFATAALCVAPLAVAQEAATTRRSASSADRGTAVSRSNPEMQRAIRFERLKNRQAAAQARREVRHPSKFSYTADRVDEHSSIKDPGERPVRKDKQDK
jgi:hypothetical protein